MDIRGSARSGPSTGGPAAVAAIRLVAGWEAKGRRLVGLAKRLRRDSFYVYDHGDPSAGCSRDAVEDTRSE